jgi:hypothetical protein
MRNGLFGRIALILLGTIAGALTMTWTQGQEPPRTLPPDLKAIDVKSALAKGPPVVRPVSGAAGPVVPKAAPTKPRSSAPFDRFRELDKLPDLTRQLVISAQTGMEWLNRYHQANGLFLYGYLPAVNQPMEGDNYIHQAEAAFVLARAARFTGDERYAVRASQAVLTLMSGTSSDSNSPGVRRPAQPSLVCNRLALAGCLVMAVHELPDAAADLVAKAEELCAFIKQQQREDGTLSYVDAPSDPVDPDGVNRYVGPALYGIALSQRLKPAAWKGELLRKAMVSYSKYFKEHADPAFVPWMTAACVEAFLATKEKAFVEFAFEMNDWLVTLQYEQSPDPRRPLWRGGFKNIVGDKVETSGPGVEAGLYAQSLADVCRLVRQMPSPDLTRYDRYRSSLIRSLQFLNTLQFTEANTLHIAANYRLMLIGGFHPTHLDGNLRVDQSAVCVSAFIQCLACGADRSQ